MMSKINGYHSLTFGNMCTRLHENTLKGLVLILLYIATDVTLTFDHKSPLITENMSLFCGPSRIKIHSVLGLYHVYMVIFILSTNDLDISP